MREGDEQKIVYREGEEIRSLWGFIEDGPDGFFRIRRRAGDVLIAKSTVIKVETRWGGNDGGR